MNKLTRIFVILSIMFFGACNYKKKNIEDVSNDKLKITNHTNNWNDCLVKKDLQTLANLYSKKVSLYGDSVSKIQAIATKEKFLKKYSDFNQSITSEIVVIKVTDEQYKASFTKRSTFNKKTIDVQGYLIFNKISGDWKITNESDDLTDKINTSTYINHKAELNSDNYASNNKLKITNLTITWNDCLVKQNLQKLARLYAEKISLYNKSISKMQAISSKENFFRKHSDFNQSIISKISVIKITDEQYKASFTKRSTFNKKTIDVQGYLIFNKISGDWKITNESDDLTDKINTSINTNNKTKLNTCRDVVMAILTTSPVYVQRFKKLNELKNKNRASSLKTILEGSPNPKEHNSAWYSETYDFKVFEDFPDHIATIGRFSFDPKDKQLYELDVELNNKRIDFDQNLLLKFNEICE